MGADRAAQQSTFTSVGESITALGSSDLANANFTILVERSWYNQNNLYDYNQNTCGSPSACEGYTQVSRLLCDNAQCVVIMILQLVWANSTALGCGASVCPTIPSFPVPNSILGQSNYIISFSSTPFYNFMREGGNYSSFIMQYYDILSVASWNRPNN